MKYRKLLAIILLSLSFCFLSAAGYGKIDERLLERSEMSRISSLLQGASIRYIMQNPTTFLHVEFHYDEERIFTEESPEGVDTKGKIVIYIRDNRDLFSKVKSLQSLSERDKTLMLDFFKAMLENVYSFIWYIATDTDTDIASKFFLTRTDPSDTNRLFTEEETISLAYFYQGEYYLWDE